MYTFSMVGSSAFISNGKTGNTAYDAPPGPPSMLELAGWLIHLLNLAGHSLAAFLTVTI